MRRLPHQYTRAEERAVGGGIVTRCGRPEILPGRVASLQTQANTTLTSAT